MDKHNISQIKKPDHNHRLWQIIVVLVICITLVIVTIFCVSYMLDTIAKNTPVEQGGLGQTADPALTEPVTEPVTEGVTEPAVIYTYYDYTEEGVHTGQLILVNAGNAYVFPENPDLFSVYENKTDSYKVSSTDLKLERNTMLALNEMMDAFYEKYNLGDVLITGGYRDYDTQMDLYSRRVEAVGLDAVTGYIALAGYSEHHTALSFDLSVYTDDGVSMTLADKTQYSWIADNCHKYGFVIRYAPGKKNITGIFGEEWHFRYVGHPHAYYMKKHDLCLEEYIDLLRGYTFEGEHLIFSDDLGGRYEIYYIPLTNGSTTKIPVPENTDYIVSGNNINGYIVTLNLS
jgi:D-alanyl-D-alanine carboxypeptidase